MRKGYKYPLVKMGDAGSIFLSFYWHLPWAKATKNGMRIWLDEAQTADMARLWLHSMNGYCGKLGIETYIIDWQEQEE